MEIYECMMSHQWPLPQGKFRSFEAGKEYRADQIPDKPVPPLFRLKAQPESVKKVKEVKENG